MTKFKKKPVVIEATHWFPLPNANDGVVYQGKDHQGEDYYFVSTLEGDMRIRPGDWLIRGIKGELYPCRDDIFRASYDAVGDEVAPTFNSEAPAQNAETQLQLMAIIAARDGLDSLKRKTPEEMCRDRGHYNASTTCLRCGLPLERWYQVYDEVHAYAGGTMTEETDQKRGLYNKYKLERTDGEHIPEEAKFFILRVDRPEDSAARAALCCYADNIHATNPQLADDLYALYEEWMGKDKR